MDQATADRLNALNIDFYSNEAASWDAHRTHAWPGWDRLLPRLPQTPINVLDVGCGNGRFGHFLAQTRSLARYVGVDACEPLLDRIRNAPPMGLTTELVQSDFIGAEPESALPPGAFDLVALFGVLHHVPSDQRRRELVTACARRVRPGGILALATWRFAEVPALRGRAISGTEMQQRIGCDPAAIGPADFLMPFGPDRSVVRYARAIDESEFEKLTDGLGLELVETFLADGRDDESNRYRILRMS